jgi:hypothetical protein
LKPGGDPVPPRALPTVGGALLNWNGWRDTIECFESLAQIAYPALDLYLCDNASSDDSIDQITAWARTAGWETCVVDHVRDGDEATALARCRAAPRLTLIRNDSNAGFARGTNIAIRYALASRRGYRYVWALNTDTEVEPSALTALVGTIESDPRVGSVQSLLVNHARPDLLDSAGIRLFHRGASKDALHGKPVAMLDLARRGTAPLEIFGCCAASALYRSEALRAVGLFDETFFQTNEDVDLAFRLRRSGYSALLVPASVVRHKGGVSRRKKRGRMWFVAHRNKLYVVARWWPRELAASALLVGVLRAWWAMIRAPDVRLAEWTGAVRALWRDFRGGAGQALRRRLFVLGRRRLDA